MKGKIQGLLMLKACLYGFDVFIDFRITVPAILYIIIWNSKIKPSCLHIFLFVYLSYFSLLLVKFPLCMETYKQILSFKQNEMFISNSVVYQT